MRKHDPKLLLQAESIPDFLKKEFMRRLGDNEKYSLRAFARDLNLSPSRLSETMNLKTGVSLPTVEKISIRLKLSKTERGVLRDLYLLEGKKNLAAREVAVQNLSKARERNKIKSLDTEKFKVIAEWYHAAIIQMTDLKDFKPNTAWISKQLDVPPERIKRAVERLFSLGLLFEENGTWKQHPDLMVTESEIPMTAIRQYHRQMMQKAFRSIEEAAIERRFIQSMTLAIPRDRYRDVCGKIQNLLKEAWELSEGDSKTDLYAINVQFFPLTDSVLRPKAEGTSK